MAGAAGIVLAGGRSSRMGTPKAALEWHGSTLLWRTAGILARATGGPVVVVRAPGQELPALPPGTEVVPDPREGLGPLQGIAAGLAALSGRAAAAYRVALAPLAAGLVARQRLRPAFLFEACTVARLDEAALRADPVLAALDPGLDSLVNVNERADYRAARARPAPPVTVRRAGALAGGHHGPRQVRAATVAGAAAAAGLEFGGRVLAVLDGVLATTDGQLPLAAGDIVSFQLRHG